MRRRSVLILTEPRDFHAYAVAEALAGREVSVTLWHGSDFPQKQTGSVWLGPGRFDCEVVGEDLAFDAAASFDVVWNRRPTSPVVPESVHPADWMLAQRDCHHFVSSLRQLVAPGALWINPLLAQSLASLKPYQLRLADEVGLEIPETLCSNDPARIAGFLRAHPGRTVFKSFNPGVWKTEHGIAQLYTTAVTAADLPDAEVLQASPGIFQLEVAKDHELRVNVFGDHACTAKLLSQQSVEGRHDWRRARSALAVEVGELPEAVARGCRALMRRLGLIFASFDFIVTPEGRHVFLEVNPMGQFLFLERLCPELTLLDRFCELLATGAVRPVRPAAAAIRYRDVRDRAMASFDAAPGRHVLKEGRVPLDFADLPEDNEGKSHGA